MYQGNILCKSQWKERCMAKAQLDLSFPHDFWVTCAQSDQIHCVKVVQDLIM